MGSGWAWLFCSRPLLLAKEGAILVHQYQLNGFNIVLDTCSGSVHAVDPVAYDAISLYETHSTEEILDQLLEQYAGQTDVTEDEILDCMLVL